MPNLKVGVCGEHGGDPDSIRFFRTCGLNYVSCSPYRVPVARLAAAQAELEFTALRGVGRGLGLRTVALPSYGVRQTSLSSFLSFHWWYAQNPTPTTSSTSSPYFSMCAARPRTRSTARPK